MRVFLDLFWYFKQEKKRYLLGIMSMILVGICNLFPPYVVGIFTDHIVEGTGNRQIYLYWSTALISVALFTYLLRYVWRIMIFGSAIKLGAVLRERLFAHFSKMAPQFYQERKVGELMAHATNDVQAVEETAGMGVLTLVDSITVSILVISTMFFFIDAPLTLIVLLPMPIMGWCMLQYGKWMHQRFHKAQAAFAQLNDKVQENISGVRVIKAFGLEEKEEEEFKRQAKDVANKNIAVAKVEALFDPTIALIVGTSFFLTVAFGAKFVLAERLTIGQLITFTMYLGELIWPLLAFGWLFSIVEKGRASYERIVSILEVEEEIRDLPTALDVKPEGNILFDIPSFTYPKQTLPSLENIFLVIPQGEVLGIVGKTGAGKTTLFRLLLREYELSKGLISIGDSSIEQLTLSALRQAIGYVPQDHFLFSATIKENISFGRPTASQAEVEEAARIACIHEDILSFPAGYNTMIGERGVTLSGGQKQRISIARALLLQPDILLLDDSLSAVDAKTEETIMQALKETRKGKTTLIAAHRLSAVQDAEQIIVLEEGKIVEKGTHQQLMEANGWYQEMFELQQLELLVSQGGKVDERAYFSRKT